MTEEALELVMRTPHRTVWSGPVTAVRVPTPTGQAGLRPGEEPLLGVLEPGLVLIHIGRERRFAATAGGLLEADRRHVELYSPFAAIGEHAEDVLDALEVALADSESEVAARRRLGELEERILQELRQSSQAPPEVTSAHR